MLIVVGPSAAGKTEVVKKLMEISKLEKLVTYTTRTIRWLEVPGKDYHFLSVDEFKEKLANNFFFEYVIYNDNYYGTAVNDISPNKVVILEPNGLQEYVERAKDLVKIVFLECSEETRHLRMINRLDQPDVIQKRLKGDKIFFTDEIKKLADLRVDSENQTVEEVAKEILEFYKPYIE
jgi:guanylate kinase